MSTVEQVRRTAEAPVAAPGAWEPIASDGPLAVAAWVLAILGAWCLLAAVVAGLLVLGDRAPGTVPLGLLGVGALAAAGLVLVEHASSRRARPHR